MSDLERKHRECHEQTGSTLCVEFSPDAPWDVMETMERAVVDLIYSWPRQGWDVFVHGYRGDADTVEYVIRCADGAVQEHGFSNGQVSHRYDAKPSTEPPDNWMDTDPTFRFTCGPHHIAQRSVGSWLPRDVEL